MTYPRTKNFKLLVISLTAIVVVLSCTLACVLSYRAGKRVAIEDAYWCGIAGGAYWTSAITGTGRVSVADLSEYPACILLSNGVKKMHDADPDADISNTISTYRDLKDLDPSTMVIVHGLITGSSDKPKQDKST